MSDTHIDASLLAPRHWPLWLVFGLLRLFAFLPWTWMMAIGRGLGRLAMRLLPRRVRIADINLSLCFPELDDEGRGKLVRRHYESMGMGVMDMAFAWWAAGSQIESLVRIHGQEHLEQALRHGKGMIFLTAHFTSVEISGRALARLAPVLPMYRPNENPVIQYLMTRNRERHVERTIPRDDVRLMLRTLKANKGVWFAPDQNYGQKNSVFSTLFGIPAATNTATSRFAEMTGAAVVPFVVIRREDSPGYDMYIEAELDDFPCGDPQRDTDRINATLEHWIRAAPAQYLWSHRRFKDLPDGGERAYL